MLEQLELGNPLVGRRMTPQPDLLTCLSHVENLQERANGFSIESPPCSRETSNAVKLYNFAALVMFRYGDLLAAEEVTKQVLSAAHHAISRGLSENWGGYLLEAYQHLLRLKLCDNRYKVGRAQLMQVLAFALGREDLQVGSLYISRHNKHLLYFCNHPGKTGDPLNMWVVAACLREVIRSLVQQEEWSNLLALVESCKSDPELIVSEDILMQLMEARALGLIGIGQCSKAVDEVVGFVKDCQCVNSSGLPSSMCLLSVEATILRRSGRTRLAISILDSILDQCHKLSTLEGDNKSSETAQWKYLAALELWVLGDRAQSYLSAAESFYQLAELKDQVGSIKSCTLILRVCCELRNKDVELWQRRLIELTNNSYYILERAVACRELCRSTGKEAYLIESTRLFERLPSVMKSHLKLKDSPDGLTDSPSVILRNFSHPLLTSLPLRLKANLLS